MILETKIIKLDKKFNQKFPTSKMMIFFKMIHRVSGHQRIVIIFNLLYLLLIFAD